MIGLLLGDRTPATTNNPKDYFFLAQFAAVKSGFVTHLGIYSLAAGNVKASIYADSSGEPGALLRAKDTDTACSASQENLIELASPVRVLGGVDYWIGINTDTHGVCGRYLASSGAVRYKSGITYSTFSAPDPAGSGFSLSSNSRSFFALGFGGSGLLFGRGMS